MATIKTTANFFFILLFISINCESTDSNLEFMCADSSCTGVIAEGKTLVTHNFHREDFISFKSDEDVQIYGTSEKELYVKIHGQIGFVSGNLIRITKKNSKVPRSRVLKRDILHEKNEDSVNSGENVSSSIVSRGSVVLAPTSTTQAAASQDQLSESKLSLSDARHDSSAITQSYDSTTPSASDGLVLTKDGCEVFEGTTVCEDVEEAVVSDSQDLTSASVTPTVVSSFSGAVTASPSLSSSYGQQATTLNNDGVENENSVRGMQTPPPQIQDENSSFWKWSIPYLKNKYEKFVNPSAKQTENGFQGGTVKAENIEKNVGEEMGKSHSVLHSESQKNNSVGKSENATEQENTDSNDLGGSSKSLLNEVESKVLDRQNEKVDETSGFTSSEYDMSSAEELTNGQSKKSEGSSEEKILGEENEREQALNIKSVHEQHMNLTVTEVQFNKEREGIQYASGEKGNEEKQVNKVETDDNRIVASEKQENTQKEEEDKKQQDVDPEILLSLGQENTQIAEEEKDKLVNTDPEGGNAAVPSKEQENTQSVEEEKVKQVNTDPEGGNETVPSKEQENTDPEGGNETVPSEEQESTQSVEEEKDKLVNTDPEGGNETVPSAGLENTEILEDKKDKQVNIYPEGENETVASAGQENGQSIEDEKDKQVNIHPEDGNETVGSEVEENTNVKEEKEYIINSEGGNEMVTSFRQGKTIGIEEEVHNKQEKIDTENGTKEILTLEGNGGSSTEEDKKGGNESKAISTEPRLNYTEPGEAVDLESDFLQEIEYAALRDSIVSENVSSEVPNEEPDSLESLILKNSTVHEEKGKVDILDVKLSNVSTEDLVSEGDMNDLISSNEDLRIDLVNVLKDSETTDLKEEYGKRRTFAIESEPNNIDDELDVKDRDSGEDDPGVGGIPSNDATSLPITEESSDWVHFFHSYLQFLIDSIPSPVRESISEMKSLGVSLPATVVTFITGILSVVFLSLHIFIQKRSKESYLNEKLCSSEQQLFKVSAERDILRDELTTAKNQSLVLHKSLQEHQNKSRPLQKQLESTTSQNGQLRTMAESLQQQLDAQRETFGQLQEERDYWTAQSQVIGEKAEALEAQVLVLTRHLQQKAEELSESRHLVDIAERQAAESQAHESTLEQTRQQLLAEAREWNSRVTELHQQLESVREEQAQSQLNVIQRDEEIQALTETLKNLSIFQSGGEGADKEVAEKLEKLLDATKTKCQLKRSLELAESRERELTAKTKECSEMEARTVELEKSQQRAVQERNEAQTKLEILSAYFKEKETHLQKELGAQVAICLQKENFVSSSQQRVAGIVQENSSFKEQLTSMKNELQETERSLKAQILAQEKKAHENWLAARAAERKLEEAKNESASLRQRLTLLERERDTSAKALPKKQEDVNGELTSSDLDDPDSSVPLRPFLLPSDRPLPPPPFHMFPPPRFLHRASPTFGPDPWHFHPMHHLPPLDRRSVNTPLGSSGRSSPPPSPHFRGRISPPFVRANRRMSPPPNDNSRTSPPRIVRARMAPNNRNGCRQSFSPPRHHELDQRPERFSPGRDFSKHQINSRFNATYLEDRRKGASSPPRTTSPKSRDPAPPV